MPKLLPIGPQPPKQLGPPPPQPPGFEDTIEDWEKKAREHMEAVQRGGEQLQRLGKDIEQFGIRMPSVPGKPELFLPAGPGFQILPRWLQNIMVFPFKLPEQTRAQMRQQMGVLVNEIERDDFYTRLYSQVPIVISGGGFTTADELLSVLQLPDNITSEELEEIEGIIGGMVETLTDIPRLPELAGEAEPVELPELVAPPTIVTTPPTTISSLTVAAIIRSVTAPKAPPSVMSRDEWETFMVESGQISDKADLETVEFLREQAGTIVDEWQERNNMLAAYKAGIAEMPDYQLVDLMKEMVIQPGIALLEVAGIYFEHVSAPLAGAIWGGYIPDLDAAFQRYRKEEGTWQALGHAWEEWDAPGEGAAEWILKYMIMEGITDPLSYVGWGIAARLARPLGPVGRWIGLAERGVADVLEIPFNLIKTGIRRLPKTVGQQANIAMAKAGQYVDKYMTQRYGKAIYQMTMDEWRQGAEAVVKYTLKNPQIDNIQTRAGREFLKHVPVTEKEVLDWADRLGTTLTTDQITRQTVDNVDRVFEDFFSKIGGSKKLITNKEAADELVRILVGKFDNETSVVAGKILLERGRGIINGALSFSGAKTTFSASRQLMRRNRKLFLDTDKSVVALARKEMGRTATLLNDIPLRVQKAWVGGIDRWVIRPFAESYLTFAMYGPMNVIEDIFRTMLGGVRPGGKTGKAFARRHAGTSYEPALVSENSISETMGYLRSARDPDWNNWILQLGGLAKGFGRTAFEYLVGVPGQISMAMRRNFVDAKYTQIMKELGGEALDTLTHTGPDKLMGVTGKRLIREVQQAAMELKMNGLPDALRAAKGDFTRVKIIRREIDEILMEHPDLPRPVRDFIMRQEDDGILFRDAGNSIDTSVREANSILIDDFVASPERATAQYEQLANLLVEFEVRNPQEMAQLIQSLNLMSSVYGATPKQILGRAVERTRGLPFAERRASMDKALDSISLFTERAGASMDKVMERIKLTIREPGKLSRVDWDKVTFGSNITREPGLESRIIGLVDELPMDIKLNIRRIDIDEEAVARLGSNVRAFWDAQERSIVFGRAAYVTPDMLYHEVAHSIVSDVLATGDRSMLIRYADVAGLPEIARKLERGIWEPTISGKKLDEAFAGDFSTYSRKPERLSSSIRDFFDEFYPKTQRDLGFSPQYISKAEQLLNLQTAKRLRASELGEQINAWRHDFFAEATPADLKRPDFWDDFSREVSGRHHASNVEMADFDGMIKNAIDDLDIAGGLKPRQRPALKIVDRELAPQDVAQLIGARGDDISRSLMDVLTSQNDKDMFTSYIMAHVKPDDVGFTKESVGRVYDQIALSLQVDPKNMSWVTGKQMELEAVRRDLHSLYNSKMLPDEEIAAIGKYFDDTADAVQEAMFESTIGPSTIRFTSGSEAVFAGEKTSFFAVEKGGKKVGTIYFDRPRSGVMRITALEITQTGVLDKAFLEDTMIEAAKMADRSGRTTLEVLSRPGQTRFYEAAGFTRHRGADVRGREGVTIGDSFTRSVKDILKSERIVPPPSPKLKSEFTNYNDLRQTAMDEAHVWYRKEFTDYSSANAFDSFMKAIYPFWTYESQRWFWLPRSFVRHPGTFTSFERWQDNTDYGYIHIPGTSVDVGFGRGTVYGTLQTRLARRDYPEYYDSLGAAGDVIEFSDFLSRYGFYPGAHIGVPLAIFGGVEMQFGEALPSIAKTPLDILIALFPDNESVRWISDHVFGDRFRKYMEILQINRRGGDGSLIFSKQQEGVALTEEEEQLLTDARREVGWYSAGFEQTGVFRMRTSEQHQMYEEASKVIEEMTGFTRDQQDWLRKHGYRLWDMVGGMSPSEQAILQEMDYYRWVGNVRPLLPGKQQEILNKIELAWDSVNRYTEQIQDSKLILQREFLSGQRGPDDYNVQLLDIYGKQREFIDNKTEEYPLMLLENRAEYYKKYGQPQPVLHPMRELMNLYFSIELEEMTDPETGEKRRDWDNFWAQRQAIEEAVPDDFKQEWEDFLSRNSTRMEQIRRDVGRTYFRTYNKVWEKILSTYSEEEQTLVNEYLFLERTGQKLDRQAEIKATKSEKTGNLLISSFRTEVSDAKKALRFANPHLDAWLFYWGRTSAFTSPGGEEVYKQIARETGRQI